MEIMTKMSKQTKILISLIIYLGLVLSIPFTSWMLVNYHEIMIVIAYYSFWAIVAIMILVVSVYAVWGIYNWLDKIDKK